MSRVSVMSWLLPWIPLVPAISAVILTLTGAWMGRTRSGRLAAGAVGAAFLLASLGFAEVLLAVPAERTIAVEVFEWVSLDTIRVSAALVLDPLSSVVILVVTGVGLLAHVYSLGYLEDSRGAHRYFASLNLLTAFMLLLVLAENFLILFVGWVGVGLCSSLLVGTWFQRKSAVDASAKTFVLNAISDLVFLLAILTIFTVFGTLRFQELSSLAPTQGTTAPSVIGILLFVGVMGKSALLPLHVWLLDAVEAPAPASALMQSATTVTAGIYVVARLASLYAEAPLALGVMAVVGAVSAVVAAAAALREDDLQRALAYSTVSQLGTMFVACGVGVFSAAVFHLVTHAFAKALLVLCAGSVVSAFGGRSGVRRMGGAKEKLPKTYGAFVVASLALVGVPPLAGFFSQSQISWGTFRSGHVFLWGAGVIVVLLTGLYLGRLWGLVFEGRSRSETDPIVAWQEHRPQVLWPLGLLGLGSVSIGLLGIPRFSAIEPWLAPYLAIASYPPTAFGREGALMFLHALLSVAGLWLGRRIFVTERRLARLATGESPGQWDLGVPERKTGLDSLYDRMLVRPLFFSSRTLLWRGVDRAILDSGLHGAVRVVRIGGESLQLLRTGSVRLYLFVLLAGAVAILGWLILGATWAS